jgi:hypothetical protein
VVVALSKHAAVDTSHLGSRSQTLTVTKLRLAVAEGRNLKNVKSLSRTLVNLREQEASGLWAPDATGRVHSAVPALQAYRARTQRALARVSAARLNGLAGVKPLIRSKPLCSL